jgi:hypothetical protein
LNSDERDFLKGASRIECIKLSKLYLFLVVDINGDSKLLASTSSVLYLASQTNPKEGLLDLGNIYLMNQNEREYFKTLPEIAKVVPRVRTGDSEELLQLEMRGKLCVHLCSGQEHISVRLRLVASRSHSGSTCSSPKYHQKIGLHRT